MCNNSCKNRRRSLSTVGDTGGVLALEGGRGSEHLVDVKEVVDSLPRLLCTLAKGQEEAMSKSPSNQTPHCCQRCVSHTEERSWRAGDKSQDVKGQHLSRASRR
eukprot:TRINITY_DN3147_c0_g1_i1.p1 TRINITY_DN3147_c0_g1~~TRINITY_DN3147_c0_g1_i1.p1  ORF type:complete len:104 (+),score=12.89 TRINITY_DN3147_c0_g1_i1:98-409(+)